MSAGYRYRQRERLPANRKSAEMLASVYSPSFPPVNRDNYKLSGIDNSLYRDALKVSNIIKLDWITAGRIYSKNKCKWGKSLIKEFQKLEDKTEEQLKLLKMVVSKKQGNEKGIKIKVRHTKYKRFKNTAASVCARLGIQHTDELTALAALLSTRTYRGKGALLNRLPDNLLNLHDLEGKQRVGLILRCVIQKKLKLRTASELESFRGLSSAINACGLASITIALSPLQIIEMAYPGITEGRDPVIRPWKIQEGTKWQGAEGVFLAKKASAWLLEFGLNIYNRNENSFDREKIKATHWYKVIEEFGMKKIIELCPQLDNSLDLIRLGASHLGHPSLIGTGENQLKPWEVRRLGMWQPEKGGLGLLDQITSYIVEEVLRKTKPHMFINNGRGQIIPEEVKYFQYWSSLYNNVASDCLRNTGVKIPLALWRVYPEIFGWENGRIGFWEMRYTGKWSGYEGTQLFKQAFANALYKSGLGQYDIESGTYSFNMEQFLEWSSMRESSDRDFFQLLSEYNLSGGIKLSAAKSSLSRAINILFTNQPGEGVAGRKPDLEKQFLRHLENSKGRLELTFPMPVFQTSKKNTDAILRKEMRRTENEKNKLRAEAIKKYIHELKQKSSLDSQKDMPLINLFINKLLAGDEIFMAALTGLDALSNMGLRADVYAVRQNYKFKSLFISEDSPQLDLS